MLSSTRCALIALVIAAIAAAGCGASDNSPCGGEALPSYELTASGITVEITTAPFGVHVLDGDGSEVLATATPGAGDVPDGYAATTWTTGKLSHLAFPTPGYDRFAAKLDPWRELEVTGADATATSVTLYLRARDEEGLSCVTQTFSVRDSTLRVEAHLETDATPPRAWSAGFATTPDEGFLGFGERFGHTNHRGHAVYSWAEEGGIGTGEDHLASPTNPYPNGEAMAYFPVPFFVSTRGYAFWLDTTWRSEFELATERDDAWRVWETGPTMAYEVYTPIPGDARPWPYQLIDLFTATTGRPMEAPAWAYGPRRRFNPNAMLDGVFEDQVMRDLDLAITTVDDARHFYPDGAQIGREDELRAWIERVEASGYRVLSYFNSMISRSPDSRLATRAAEGVENGYFLADADGAFPNVWILTGGKLVELYVVDFTSAAATDFYAATFDEATDLGYSGFMYDFGEYVQPQVVASNGMTGEELHNLYPVLYAKALHDHMEAGPLAGDWFSFMRSGYTGSAQYVPGVWSGDPAASFEDSDGLPSMLRAGINIGISGVPNWGGDIGGFHCLADGAEAADGELLTRWIQQGALTPIMQDQNGCVGGDISIKATLWTSPDAQAAWKTYARLHTRLEPYFRALGKEAHETGAPIIRHVFLEHPDRLDLAGEDTAYYLGQALYVAPVITRGAVTKTVELPAGTYLDWQEEILIDGGREVTLDAPLAKLPLLLRAGYLVPLLDPTIDTLATENDPDIVSANDVDDVYDVVGLLVTGEAGEAHFTLHDGGTLDASWSGGFAAPTGLTEAASDAELSTCDGCFKRDTLAPTLDRVRISAPAGTVTAGGLTVTSQTGRRIRWDLYLVTP